MTLGKLGVTLEFAWALKLYDRTREYSSFPSGRVSLSRYNGAMMDSAGRRYLRSLSTVTCETNRSQCQLQPIISILTETNACFNLFFSTYRSSNVQASYFRVEMYNALAASEVSSKLYTVELDVDIHGMLAQARPELS